MVQTGLKLSGSHPARFKACHAVRKDQRTPNSYNVHVYCTTAILSLCAYPHAVLMGRQMNNEAAAAGHTHNVLELMHAVEVDSMRSVEQC